ncbi:conserved hypothetical protein [Renibacterium salmoninarum ATCC 33209]|uniref:DUF3710 domain-containing protein n=1 Tax=Renibacterium salmoninarum (strain ATCC 33209 / DSM 20767 / JCM 11484 / NBRC 15589 / NCIMB 2235) TaxID=288705 RepID=A9WRC1_RENSM|nr:DUF3710 domain-containing protein [Renibacterium salmoninarum]ABY24130.1 conserved hypothetical protein [Renibacterium salmoninarum ATCC 33209]
MVFGRKQSNSNKSAEETAETVATESELDSTDAELESTELAAADPLDSAYEREEHGPFDIDEIESHDGYVDLGALLITPHDGLQLRLEVEESSQRVIAVTLDLEGSSLQLQAFAAPRSEGLWPDIREQIGLSVASQGGSVEELHSTFGPEILAKLPAEAADGSKGFRVARFIGVDGPRWFLRGVLGGDAALESEAANELEALFRAVVVVRGEVPMPPRDLLPLSLPKDAVPDTQGQVAADEPAAGEAGKFGPIDRGPEITQIG